MNPHKFAFFVYIGKTYRLKININKHIEQSLLPYFYLYFHRKSFSFQIQSLFSKNITKNVSKRIK